jgi:hypothetical protein
VRAGGRDLGALVALERTEEGHQLVSGDNDLRNPPVSAASR